MRASTFVGRDRRSIEHAAGRAFIAPVDIAGTFTVRVDPSSGEVSATRADRLEEVGYRAAIDVALESRPAPIAETRVPSTLGDVSVAVVELLGKERTRRCTW